MRRTLKLVTIFVILVAFSSCANIDNTEVKKELPITVSKLANIEKFDTLTVIKEDTYIHIYEKGEYKQSIELEGPDLGLIIIGCIVIGVIFGIFLGSMFNN